ncbi:MAG: hypothetical protein E7472_05735 [Ruminococcaceae bacterium]|nr:hypothetical protein [Oscillospiraceae bacterium]
MRTLKKTLCLVLVVVMMAGLCSIGTSAAFVDADKITYAQAADVLNALGVLKGDENGFRPQDGITRAEACVIIARLLDAEGIKGTATFTDLAGYGWAKDAIAFCEAEGIVAGNGDGTFNPGGKLTGYAFAKMLFCACGYNADREGMTGANWEIGVAKMVKNEKIAKHIAGFDGTAACTREEAAELAYEAAKNVDLVEYVEGTTVSGAGFVVSTQGGYDNDVLNDCLLVTNFGLTPTYNPTDSVVNDLGQPVVKYDNAAKKIHISVVKEAVATFTAATKAKDIATALEGYVLTNGGNSYKVSENVTIANTQTVLACGLTVDANEKTAAALAGETAPGTLVEVYANEDKEITKIVKIQYATYKVSDVKTQKNGNVDYTINSQTYTDFADAAETDEISFVTAPAKGDIVTVKVVTPGTKIYVYPTTSFTGTQTAKTSDDKVITIDGTKYTVSASKAAGTEGTFNNSAAAAVYYLDQYGYVVYTTSTAASTDYAYIVNATGKETTTIDGATYEVTVRAVLADGTVGTYPLALRKASGSTYIKGLTAATSLYNSKTGADALTSAVASTVSGASNDGGLIGQIFGYTLSDGVMTLEEINQTATYAKGSVVRGTTSAAVADKATSATTASANGSQTLLLNSATKIVVYNSNSKTATVYNGTSALPSTFSETLAYVGKANDVNAAVTASIAFVSAVIDADAGTDLVYIDHTKYTISQSGTDTFNIYTATYANGETVNLSYKNDTLDYSGLYTFEGTSIKNEWLKCNESGQKYDISTSSLVTADAKFVYDATLTVTSGMLKYTVSGTETYANITDATQTVYANTKLDEVNNNGGYVVLGWANGAATGDVAQIFITVD